MAWVNILPGYANLFRQRGWDSAAPFLAWTGVLVNRHRNRQVEQVTLNDRPEPCFFLKKAHAVTWGERLRNAWHGFGWCATAVREAAILQTARAAGVGCPEVVACGEDKRRAFVLLRPASAMTELRALLPTLGSDAERNRLADALGLALARLHDAGFEHPDLFAKHILVARSDATFRFCILDWARARCRRTISWTLRCRDLAALDATLHEALAGDRLRLRCLRSYCRALTSECACPAFGRMARQIRRVAERRRRERNMREIGQLPTLPADQQLVPHCDGRLLVVRSYHERLGGNLPDWLGALVESNARMEDFTITTVGASDSAKLCVQSWLCSSQAWDIPPLAHTLFRLQRFGVPAPRLLAVGASAGRIYVVTAAPATLPFDDAFAKATHARRGRMLLQAGWIIRQIHEAGHFLPPGDLWSRRLGVAVASGDVMLAKVEPLLRGNAPWKELAPRELTRQEFRLSRAEQLRFLRGYLRRHGSDVNTKKVVLQNGPIKERQPAA